MEALPSEAPPLAAHEASAGVRQPKEWWKSGNLSSTWLSEYVFVLGLVSL